MPRIIPRLLKQLNTQHASEQRYIPFDIKAIRKPRKSIYAAVEGRPPLQSTHFQKSILLNPVNPVTQSRRYARHKTFPPRVYIPRNAKSRQNENDQPRYMSIDELAWGASPYLRMMASPIRKCIVTDRYLPSDFLIRLGPMRLPQLTSDARAPSSVLIPDGLQHTKFTSRRAGRAVYILCSRQAIEKMNDRGTNIKRVAHHMTQHPWLADHIAHLLRLRILQDLQIIVDQLQSRPHWLGKHRLSCILKRLSRDEFNDIKTTGIIPFNALAVLVAPPLNRDPLSKKRPLGALSAEPPSLDDDPHSLPPLPPVCSLYPTNPCTQHGFGDANYILSSKKVPLYNGLSLFPSRSQRAAFRSLLSKLVDLESKGQSTTNLPLTSSKKSHAYLLSADHNTMKRADVASLGVALWRLKMFENDGRRNDDHNWC